MNPESVIKYCYDYNIFIYGMIFFCIAGIVIKCGVLGSYHRLQKSLLGAKEKDKGLLLKISVKLNQALKTQKKSFHVDAFVDKYMIEWKSCGLLLSTWESICGQMTSVCLLIASCAGILGIFYQCEQSRILLTFLTGAWTAILVYIVNNVVSISRRKRNVILYLTEYINNILFEEGIEVPGFYKNPLDEWKNGIPKTRKILRRQEKLRLLKEEIAYQQNLLAKELSESLDREHKAFLKKEQREKEKEDKLKKAEDRKQKALQKKQEKEEEALEKKEHISFRDRRKTRALIKNQLHLEMEKSKREKEEQKISARLQNEQEKERRRIARQEQKEKEGQEKKSRAYEEKMRLKREKERADVIRQQEAAREGSEQQKPKKEEIPIVQIPQDSLLEETQTVPSNDLEEDFDYDSGYEDSAKEVKDQAATSQEDEVLLEEVLKDFFY